MQSKYFSPFSLNIYCPFADTILSGSALKNNLHDGLLRKRSFININQSLLVDVKQLE